MLIHDSTLEALDWAVLREAQADLCATNRARSRVRANDFADSRSDALRRYRAVAELWLLEDLGQRPSLNAIHDVSGYTSRAAKGEVLEPHELVEVGQSLGAMAAL
ncbi:MAG: hypothetical protein VX944_15160, partial [Myxococcota bacterium]|nr:hypothetical protein [Myxococcota bacterium]